MTDRIEPALTAEEWRRRERKFTVREMDGTVYFPTDAGGYNVEASVNGVAGLTATIALANAALPDGDPRKITRERVKLLADVAASIRPPQDIDAAREVLSAKVLLAEFADALSSYLSPEEP